MTYQNLSGNSTWTQNSMIYYEIRGLQNNKCVFYQKLSSISGNFTSTEWPILLSNPTPPNTTDEINIIVQQMNSTLQNMVGNTETCNYPISDLTYSLNNLKSTGRFNLSSNNIITYNCTGSLI